MVKVRIPKEKWFFFKNGRHASSIEELCRALEWLGDDEFRFHVNMQRNDFANWVEDVFHEGELAHSMREVAEREGLLIILDEYLKNKSKKENKKKGEGRAMKLVKQLKKVKKDKEGFKGFGRGKVKKIKEKKRQEVDDQKKPSIKSLYEKKLSENDIRSIVTFLAFIVHRPFTCRFHRIQYRSSNFPTEPQTIYFC